MALSVWVLWESPWPSNLITGGHSVFLYSRSGVPKELVEQGGKPCISAKQVAQKADIIITMLPDTPDVEKVLFGENGVAQGLSKRENCNGYELSFSY